MEKQVFNQLKIQLQINEFKHKKKNSYTNRCGKKGLVADLG